MAIKRSGDKGALGIACSITTRGLAELRGDASCDVRTRRVRRPGGGRTKLTKTDATLLSDLRLAVMLHGI